jgi:hypothetical protein
MDQRYRLLALKNGSQLDYTIEDKTMTGGEEITAELRIIGYLTDLEFLRLPTSSRLGTLISSYSDWLPIGRHSRDNIYLKQRYLDWILPPLEMRYLAFTP